MVCARGSRPLEISRERERAPAQKAGGIERGSTHVVSALEIALQGVDEEDEQLAGGVEEEGGGEVAHALLCERRALRHVDGVDVPELDAVSEHLTVHHSDDELSHSPLRLRVGQVHPQVYHLAPDDRVLLLLALAVADPPDKLHELA